MKPKNPSRLFPLFLTSRLEETKSFYTSKAGFRVTVETPSYLQVQLGEVDGPELCFMKPDAFPDGRAREPFGGQGVMVSVPVEDADRKYAELKEAGAALTEGPTDKPWGWRSFVAVDPNGVALDFFHVYKEVDLASLKM
jgi:uncharacterized glyoxalase superfamily protein PhnB